MSKEAMHTALEALEMARTGLQWYRGMMPEYVDGSDGEADEQIGAALSLLRAELEAGGEPVAWLLTGSKWFVDSAHTSEESAQRTRERRGGKDTATIVPLYASPVAADTQGDAK